MPNDTPNVFDLAGARSDGYSDDEIAQHLAQRNNFNLSGARKDGYSSAEIVKHLMQREGAQALQAVTSVPAGGPISTPFNFSQTLGTSVGPMLRRQLPAHPLPAPMPKPPVTPELQNLSEAELHAQQSPEQMVRQYSEDISPLGLASQAPKLAGTQAYLKESWLPRWASMLGADEPTLHQAYHEFQQGRYKAGTADVIGGGFEALTPAMAYLGVRSPMPMARGLVAAGLGSEVSGAVASRMGASPDSQALARALGGLIPGGAEAFHGFSDELKLRTIGDVEQSVKSLNPHYTEEQAHAEATQRFENFEASGDPKYINFPGVKQEGLRWLLKKGITKATQLAKASTATGGAAIQAKEDLATLRERLAAIDQTRPSESTEPAPPTPITKPAPEVSPPKGEWIPVTRGVVKGEESLKPYAGTDETWFIKGHGPEAEAGAMAYAKLKGVKGEPRIVKGWVHEDALLPSGRAAGDIEGDPISARYSQLENNFKLKEESPTDLSVRGLTYFRDQATDPAKRAYLEAQIARVQGVSPNAETPQAPLVPPPSEAAPVGTPEAASQQLAPQRPQEVATLKAELKVAKEQARKANEEFAATPLSTTTHMGRRAALREQSASADAKIKALESELKQYSKPAVPPRAQEVAPLKSTLTPKSSVPNKVRDFYTPGNIVRLGDQYHAVLSYKELPNAVGKGTHWEAEVVAVDAAGNPLEGAKIETTTQTPFNKDRVVKRTQGTNVSLFGADIVAKKIAEDVAPVLEKVGLTFVEGLQGLRRSLTPRGVVERPGLFSRSAEGVKTLDTMSRALGRREQREFALDHMLDKTKDAFNALPKASQVQFIDNIKLGRPQGSPELQAVADGFRDIDEDGGLRVVNAQIRRNFEGDKAVQRVWNALPDAYKRALWHNQDAILNDPAADPVVKRIADGILEFKRDHYRVFWDKIPGGIDPTTGLRDPATAYEKLKGIFRGRRPFEGDRGFFRHATLGSMSEGIAAGGEPISYNPVVLFKMGQMSQERYITASDMWMDAKDQNARVFAGLGKPIPAGFTKFTEDQMGTVRFKAPEGFTTTGNWYLRDDYHLLMSHYLSDDWIRNQVYGRGLISLKNNLTAFRLGFSPFHAIVESLSAIGTKFGVGAQRAVNLGVRRGDIGQVAKGAKDMALAMTAPFELPHLGTSAIRYVSDPQAFLATSRGADFVRQYPEVERMLQDMFNAGAKLAMHEDITPHAIDNLRQTWANAGMLVNIPNPLEHPLDFAREAGTHPIRFTKEIAKLGKAAAIQEWNHPITTIPEQAWKTFWATSEAVYRPLFNYYIPRMKLGAFLKEYSVVLVDHEADLASGKMTRGELGRQTWNSIEDMFGQVNWDKFFWSRNTKTSTQLAFRAAQWAAGNVRFGSQALTGQAFETLESLKHVYNKINPGNPFDELPSTTSVPRLDPRMAKLVGLAVAWTTTNALIQLAFTHELPKDPKDLMAPRIGGLDSYGHPRRVSTPVIEFKDLLALRYGGGVRNYLSAKKSDLFSGAIDAWTNTNFRNDLVTNPEDDFWKQGYDELKHFVGEPIALQNVLQARDQELPRDQQVLSMFGVKPPPTGFGFSRMEDYVYETAKRDMRAMSPEEQTKLQTYHHTLNKFQSGEYTIPDLFKLVDQGRLTTSDLNRLEKERPYSALQRHFTRLKTPEAIRAYEYGTPSERKEVQPILLQKLNRIYSDYPAEEAKAMENKVRDLLK